VHKIEIDGSKLLLVSYLYVDCVNPGVSLKKLIKHRILKSEPTDLKTAINGRR
jgi:hypothetical protein